MVSTAKAYYVPYSSPAAGIRGRQWDFCKLHAAEAFEPCLDISNKEIISVINEY